MIEEILIVRHAENYFGIDTDAIEHILRVLEITPLPFSPKEVRGFCSIEGRILTVLDLSRLLLNEKNVDLTLEGARLISVSIKDMHYSLLLEEVINNIMIDQKKIEYLSHEDRRRDGVIAAYKYEGDIIQVLDLERLVANIKKLTFERRDFSEKYETDIKRQNTDNESRRYCIFTMGREQYAIDVNNIREVIAVPEFFTEMADSGDEILGMITLREEIVVTVDLRYIYDLPCKRKDENRIIVVQLGSKVVGLLVDSIVDIADFQISEISNRPSNFRDDKIEGVVRRGKNLISLVNINVINEIINAESRIDNSISNEIVAVKESDTVEIVSFYLDDNMYALHTEDIVEIIDNFKVTKVADMPEMVDGITNIRGKVIPVISLYKRLNLHRAKEGATKLLVCQFKGNDIGLLVDAVKDVSNISKDLFLPEEESVYFSNIIKIEHNQVILMINLDRVLQI